MSKQIILLVLVMSFCTCTSKIPAKSGLRYSNKTISQPEIFAEGIISTKENSEFDITFTPNGRTAFFTRRTGNEKQQLWQTKFKDGHWSHPVKLPFSTDRDETPFFASDGKTLYFGSARPIEGRPGKGKFDMNIWQAEWTDKEWSKPEPLSENINAVQSENEDWPSSNENFIFSLDNVNFIYSTMLRGSKTIEIYKTVKTGNGFSQPEKISGLFRNDKSWKYSAVLSPDGQYLLFNSYEAEDGVGGEDIFIARKSSNGWTRAKNIGKMVNTKAEESSPRFSPDGKYFFFAREVRQSPGQDGIWNIYYVETEYLDFEGIFKN
ncbi:MAG TPA: hypothetical protein DHV17_07560 [Chitinophagaceae bacterium]|nr:hypothetical protein [Chitinophagaceae bacterium]